MLVVVLRNLFPETINATQKPQSGTLTGGGSDTRTCFQRPMVVCEKPARSLIYNVGSVSLMLCFSVDLWAAARLHSSVAKISTCTVTEYVEVYSVS